MASSVSLDTDKAGQRGGGPATGDGFSQFRAYILQSFAIAITAIFKRTNSHKGILRTFFMDVRCPICNVVVANAPSDTGRTMDLAAAAAAMHLQFTCESHSAYITATISPFQRGSKSLFAFGFLSHCFEGSFLKELCVTVNNMGNSRVTCAIKSLVFLFHCLAS